MIRVQQDVETAPPFNGDQSCQEDGKHQGEMTHDRRQRALGGRYEMSHNDAWDDEAERSDENEFEQSLLSWIVRASYTKRRQYNHAQQPEPVEPAIEL